MSKNELPGLPKWSPNGAQKLKKSSPEIQNETLRNRMPPRPPQISKKRPKWSPNGGQMEPLGHPFAPKMEPGCQHWRIKSDNNFMYFCIPNRLIFIKCSTSKIIHLTFHFVTVSWKHYFTTARTSKII